MRISTFEKDTILTAIHVQDSAAEVYLFGSRTRDDLKGGDIDLLVLSDTIGLTGKLDILVAIKSRIGDQRIDLKILTRAAAPTDVFAQSVLGGAVRLG